MDTNESTTTPAKRGYWAGFKDIGQFGKVFWVLVLLLAIPTTVLQSFDPLIYDDLIKPNLSGNTDWPFIFSITGSISLILFGSVLDWLGLRRILQILYTGLLICCMSVYLAWLIMGEQFPSIIWIISLLIFTVFGKFALVAGYRGIRRFTTRKLRTQAIIISNLTITVFTVIWLTASESVIYGTKDLVPSVETTNPHIIALFAVVLATGIIFIWKWSKNERQIGDEVDGSNNVLYPSGPFTGLAQILHLSATWRLVGLAVILSLTDYCVSNVQYSIFSSYRTMNFLETDFSITMITLSSVLISFIFLILLFPVIGRISISGMIKGCVFAMFIAVLLLVAPLDEGLLFISTFLGILLLNGASLFLMVRFFEYVLNTTPVGLEGSMVAVLGIVWLLNIPFNKMMAWLLNSQKNADWTYTFTQAINADASNAHALWLIVLVPVALGTLLLFVFNRYLFDEVA